MRNLTIKREKSFVGCLAKLGVYIETETDAELSIENIPCKKLGTLKNGEEKTFSAEGGARHVFVIADKVTKEYCNDRFLLPDGCDDVVLTGKNRFNPALGNAFIFDNNNSEGALQSRSKNKKTGLVVLIVAVIIGAIVGYVISSNLHISKVTDKTFSADGMSITLTNEFNEIDVENYVAAYDSRDIAVFALKESFSLSEGLGDLSINEYAELVKENNDYDESELQRTDEGLNYFSYKYKNAQTDLTYVYYTYLFKTDDSFWIVQFAVLESDAEKQFDKIESFAGSVSFQ